MIHCFIVKHRNTFPFKKESLIFSLIKDEPMFQAPQKKRSKTCSTCSTALVKQKMDFNDKRRKNVRKLYIRGVLACHWVMVKCDTNMEDKEGMGFNTIANAHGGVKKPNAIEHCDSKVINNSTR